MPTYPARVRRTDPGNPEKCPVWALHKTYTDSRTHDWIQKECGIAGIGCVDCKQPLIDAILAEQSEILERAEPYEKDKSRLVKVIEQGNERAREVARETMLMVRDSVGTRYKDLSHMASTQSNPDQADLPPIAGLPRQGRAAVGEEPLLLCQRILSGDRHRPDHGALPRIGAFHDQGAHGGIGERMTRDEEARAILKANDRGGYTVPTAGLYPYQWNWDSVFAALGFAEHDIGRAWAEIETLFAGQWPNGMVPHILFHKVDPSYFPGPDVWKGVGPIPSSGISQPPIAGTFIRWLLEMDESHAAQRSRRRRIHDPFQRGLVRRSPRRRLLPDRR